MGNASQSASGDEIGQAGVETLRAYAQVLDLAREAASKAQYLKGLPEAVAGAFGSAYAAIYARLPAEVVEGRYCADGTNPTFWKPPVEALLTAVLEEVRPMGRLYRTRRANGMVAAIAAPIRTADGGLAGALALIVPSSGEEHARTLQRSLESVAHLASCYGARFDLENAAPRPTGDAASATQLSRAARFQTTQELAFAVANNLRNQTGSEQVSVGLSHSSRVSVLAISGYDEVKEQSPGVASLRAAMEECADVEGRVVFQTEPQFADDPLSTGHRIHRQWHDENGGGAVASLPFRVGTNRVVVVSMRRAPTQPFSREELDRVHEMVAPFMDAFGLIERAARPLSVHAADFLSEWIERARAEENRVRTALVAAAAIGVLWFFFGSLDYRVSAPATVVPSESRHLSAPFEGTLAEVQVAPGDRVHAGQELAALDRQELILERDRLSAELVASRLAGGEAMAGGAAVAVGIAQAQQRLLRAQIETLAHRIELAVVRAPFDGLVVSGDLRKRIGQRVPLGEPLFELAPNEGWVLELAVPEYAAADLAVGLVGDFASHARPDQSAPFEIVRVTPSAETREGRNVYVAEAEVDLDSSWVRAGVEGVSKIEVGAKPVWWTLLHKLTDYLRLHFWL